MLPDEILHGLAPGPVYIKRIVKIEDEIPDQIGMEVVRVMAGHSLEKSGVPVEPAEIFHQIIIHLFRVQECGLVTGPQMPQWPSAHGGPYRDTPESPGAAVPPPSPGREFPARPGSYP